MSKFLTKIVDQYPALKYALLDAQTFDPTHFGFPPVYYKIMETDAVRVNAFRDSFKKYNHLKNKVVCEVGVGTLALTKHFLPYVKKAYLIELNPDLTNFIKKEIKKGGWENKVEFMVADATKVMLPEKVDYIIGENMSIYCANEHQVQIFQHLRQFLKPKGKLIPEKIINLIQLGQADFKKEITHYPIMFTRHLPTLLSAQKQVNTINLYKTTDRPVKKTIKIRPLLSGIANCVYLRSMVQCSEGFNFTGTDSLMPPTVVALEKPVKLTAGKAVDLEVAFRYGTSLDEAKFRITK